MSDSFFYSTYTQHLAYFFSLFFLLSWFKIYVMKKLIVFIFSILLSSCQKDNNDCNEAIPYCNEMILQYYQPVCGCNDVTYPNWETAECHGILN